MKNVSDEHLHMLLELAMGRCHHEQLLFVGQQLPGFTELQQTL